jgi:hypothetical protein
MNYYKYLAALGFILVIFIGGVAYGYNKAADKYLPQIAQKQAVLDQITRDTEAKLKQQKADNDKLKQDADIRIAAIRDYYKRLLPRPSDSSGTDSSGNQGHDGATSKSTITGCDRGFEQNCALDANMVNTWRAWCTAHKCPVL